MPLNSAPNSCAVISCRGCSPSSNGIAYVPCSNRFAHTANPSRSQYRIFTRSRLRLANTNRCPANASSFRQSVTSACNPSKLLRMSHGHAHRYTRTLAGRCIMRGLRELPTPCVALSRLRQLRCASDVPNAALTPPQPFPAPLACPSLPVRIAPEPAPLPAASATDRRTAALRRADGRSFPPFVHFASARRSPPSSARADPNICHLSWKVSSSPVCSNPSILNSGVHRALTLVHLLRPWLNLVRLEVHGNIPVIRAVSRPKPDARQVGLAIRGSRHGRGQIRLAVRRPRDAWGLVIEPLRRQGSGQ